MNMWAAAVPPFPACGHDHHFASRRQDLAFVGRILSRTEQMKTNAENAFKAGGPQLVNFRIVLPENYA